MKRLFLMITVGLALFVTSGNVFGQEDNGDGDEKLSLSLDLASGFIWRGLPNNLSPVVQPAITFKPGRFSIGTWASTPISPWGGDQEIDIFAEFEISSALKLGITDYYVYGSNSDPSYFNFDKDKTCHALDFMLMYESAGGFKAMLSTIFAGADLNNDGKNNFSTYIEIGYGRTFKKMDWSLCLGFVPMESGFYDLEDANFVNIGLGVSKSFEITPTYSLPLSLNFTINPAAKAAFLVATVSLF